MKSALTLLTCFYACWIQAQSFELDWVRQMGGTNTDGVTAMQPDEAGNLYTAGFFKGPADFDPGAGVATLTGQAVDSWERDMFVGKYNAAGALVWVKEFSGPQYKAVTDLVLAPNGDLLVTGFFEGTVDFSPSLAFTAPAGNFHSFAARLNAAGFLLWVKVFGGCTDPYGAVAIETDAAGNAVMTGTFDGTRDFDTGAGTAEMTAPGYQSAFILKLDSAGDFVWARQIDDPNFAYGTALDVDDIGNVYAGGTFSWNTDLDPGPGNAPAISNGWNDTYLIKLDPDGAFLWEKHYGGQESDQLSTINVGANGNIYLTGMYGDESTDYNTGAGTCYLAWNGWVDLYMMKLDAAGDFAWCKGIGGEEYDGTTTVLLDTLENIFVAGRFRMEMDFDPGPGVFLMESAGSGADDAFALKLDTDGNFDWAFQLHGNMNYIDGIGFGPGNSFYAAGIFQNPTDFDPGPGEEILYAAGGYSNAFIMRLGGVLSAPELSAAGGLICYPNPMGESLTIQLKDLSPDATLRLTGINGELVHEWTQLSAGSMTIPTGHLAAGMYVVELREENAVQRVKVVR
jgi:hypothetical protein